MQDLIKIENTTIRDACVPTVNARELYRFLESKRKFSDWIKAKIERLRLLENRDYLTVSQNCEIAKGGYQPITEYFITVDSAKHIALMENTDRGFEVREYFIDCEKKLRALATSKEKYLLDIVMADDVKERALALSDYELGYVKPLEQFKEQSLPKVSYYDNVLNSPDLVTITQIAKEGALARPPLSSKQSFFAEYCGMTAIELNKLLESLNIQYKQSGQWLLYKDYAKSGYTQSSTYVTELGNSKLNTKWTQRGRLFIYEMLKSKGILPVCEAP